MLASYQFAGPIEQREEKLQRLRPDRDSCSGTDELSRAHIEQEFLEAVKPGRANWRVHGLNSVVVHSSLLPFPIRYQTKSHVRHLSI